MSDFPNHVGGGWYELSNGEKVQGKEEAVAQEELLGDAANEPVEDEADVQEAVEPDVVSEAVSNYAQNTEGVVDDAQSMIIRMTSANVKRQLRGYEWSRNNPFAVVAAEDADFILSKDGFERATPAQVEKFYE